MANNDEEFGDIIDYVRGDLEPDRVPEVEARIQKDPILQRLAELLRAIRAEAVSGDWRSLKPAAHALLERQLRDRRRKRATTKIEHGITVFDSRLLPLPEGVRPALVDTGHIRYRIGDEILEVSVYPVSVNSFEVIGRFTGIAERKGTATLRKGKKKYSAETNEFGLFRFPRITRGQYVLEVSCGGEVFGKVDLET